MQALEEELDVMRAIFGEDFLEVESKSAWTKVHEFEIRIRAQDEGIQDKVIPTFILHSEIGLSSIAVNQLKNKLISTSTSLLGTSSMLYELCSMASAFITDRHGLITKISESLGSERQLRAEEEKRNNLRKKEERELEQKEADRANANQLSLLITEGISRKELLLMDRNEKETKRLAEEAEVEARAVVVETSSEISVPIWTSSGERLAKVTLGLSIVGDWLGRVQATEMRIGNASPTTGSAHYFEIISAFYLTQQGKRKLEKITQIVDRVSPIQHPHLASVYGSLLSRSPQGHILVVLVETIRSQTLHDLLLAASELRPDRALHFFTMLVGAVERLHRENIVHGAISPKMISVGVEGIKLSGAAWYQRLVNLNKSDSWTTPLIEEDLFEDWICPEALENPFVYDKKRDMWELGVVLAQMVLGLDVASQYSSPAELIRASNSAPAIRKILLDLFNIDGRKRITAATLLAHLSESSSSKTLTNPITNISERPTSSAMKSVDSHSQPGIFWQPRVSGSRYRAEFEELEFLGRGGQVVKSRNRLDGHLYAIKKVRIPNFSGGESKLLREVTLFSRMNHGNIVRYHTSWIETEEIDRAEPEQSQQTETTRTRSNQEDSTPSSTSASSDFEESSDDGAETAEDIDLGLDDLEDLDALDFLSHAKSLSSHPRIHFGKEEDLSNVNSPIDSTRANSPNIIKSIRTLFIQMEYVENFTLKEAIEEGVSEMDAWRLINQILGATLHFTNLGILHRDLKPANIFLDSNGDVKIGDFGLAVNQNSAVEGNDSNFLSIESSIDEVDLTSGVGTSLYIAPETLSNKRMDRNVKYSNKIDMYSLGVVFFELFQPFKTGMERIFVLRDLRKPEIIFPESWNHPRLARQAAIIRKCLVHDPELRLSPKELLESDLLPPRVGSDSISETIRLLSHSGTQHAQNLINALFDSNKDNLVETLRRDHTYDHSIIDEPKPIDDRPVRDLLAKLFRLKGAVEMDAPNLMPNSAIYGLRKPVQLLDTDGNVLILPFILSIPFYRMVSRDSGNRRLKRFSISHVFRQSPGGGAPRAILNAAFDIVSDCVTAATEAEVIFVADESISAFLSEGQGGETVTFVNHEKILQGLFVAVPPQQRGEVFTILIAHGRLQRTWAKTSQLLKVTGISKLLVDAWANLDIAGDIKDLRAKLLAFNSPLKHLIREGLDQLEEVIALSTQLGVKRIKFAPLLAQDHDLHKDGLLFETALVRGKIREVIAAGGRFDEVISQFAPPNSGGRLPHAVGFSLAVAKLSDIVAASALSIKATTFGPFTNRRCDVFVVTFSTAGLVDLRLDITKDLWKASISADLMYDDDLLKLSPEQLMLALRREGIQWMVIVKQAVKSDEHILKLKSVLRGLEAEVRRSDLVAWLHRELAKQAIVDGSNNLDLPIESAFQPYQSRPKQEIFALIPDDDVRQKGRNKQKSIYLEKATANVKSSTSAAAEAPVFSIDVDGLAFRKLSESANWIHDSEAFRAVLDVANPSKRNYLTFIRASIQKYKLSRPEARLIWIFSLRDDRSCLLTLDWQ